MSASGVPFETRIRRLHEFARQVIVTETPPQTLLREFEMLLAILCIVVTTADDFDRLEGTPLAGIAKSTDARSREVLTIGDLGTLPSVLVGTRSPLVIVKTDEGNPARLLVTPALRKPSGGQREPVPVLIIERFDTFEAGPATRRIAKGKDVMLFDGFRFDLDSGQMVPDGHGGDIQFMVGGEGGPRLVPMKGAAMFTLDKSPLGTPEGPRRPSSGRAVTKPDFAGRYRLLANGQTSGRLDLEVDATGVVSGRLRSDQTGGSYKVTGQAGTEAPNKIRFAVDLPRARQEFTGYLFVEGKGAIAGSFDLLGREFGFFALREGGTLSPEGEDVASSIADDSRPGRVAIDIAPASMSLDGKAADDAAVGSAMKAALEKEASAWAQIRVAPDVSAERLLKVVEMLRGAGATSIRLSPAVAK